ncbi:unnamed protein product [Rotaria sordida]|uniref:F-box domain-containing protein n=1 Tax=Rotaria sordida TaxID=392033 RepID=A0A814D1W7_9BILA|nr:unnamed protein product [Rotaria sordida]CAF3536571.1 unnamed protein product [Rotaria sordida]
MMSSNQFSNLNVFQLNLNNNQSIIRLEDLPNELFYVLFNYLEIKDIYKSFFGLNLRFNILFNSLSNCYLRIESSTKVDFINMIASKIRHIHITQNSISISLAPFRNTLHSLIIHLLTDEYIDQLHALMYLKRLEIRHIPQHSIGHLRKVLFSSPQIKHLVLPFWHSKDLVIAYSSPYSISSIHSLSMYSPNDLDDFASLLGRLPNLIRLRLDIDYIKVLPTVNGSLSNVFHSLSYFHLQLKNGFTYSQIDFYLTHVPNLKSFRFFTAPCLIYRNQMGPYGVLNTLAEVIEKHLLILEQFSCFITFHMISNDLFDITKVNSIYNQNYSIKFENNQEHFKSKWIKT